MILTRRQLDVGRCNMPGCTHQDHDDNLFLHGRCHVRAALHARYDKHSGVLTLLCAECTRPIAQLRVSDE